MSARQNRTIQLTITLPMDFPSDWTDDDIEFYLNESSYCLSNVLDIVHKYEEEHGCICAISEAHLIDR